MKSRNHQYYIISGLNLNDNNRGTAALGYGSFYFFHELYRKETDKLKACSLIRYKKPWKFGFRSGADIEVKLGEYESVILKYIYVWFIDLWVYQHVAFLSKLTKTARVLKKVKFVATINGGDGFSDIYGSATFEGRLFETTLAMKEGIPLMFLPQTLGPFKDESNLKKAERILKYATNVYVRDTKFESQLKRWGVEFKLIKDLSYHMKPEKVDIEILPNAVGLNISGLCYFNKFRDLAGQFDCYPYLINEIIKYFQDRDISVYLLSHSYNYKEPDEANDDLTAAREVYDMLKNKEHVYLIDKDFTSPQTKYIISKFCFFIGTRMHANFAAIYTNTPVFGLAYSYKYEGAFSSLGLNDSYASVINMEKGDIDIIIRNISEKYNQALH